MGSVSFSAASFIASGCSIAVQELWSDQTSRVVSDPRLMLCMHHRNVRLRPQSSSVHRGERDGRRWSLDIINHRDLGIPKEARQLSNVNLVGIKRKAAQADTPAGAQEFQSDELPLSVVINGRRSSTTRV